MSIDRRPASKGTSKDIKHTKVDSLVSILSEVAESMRIAVKRSSANDDSEYAVKFNHLTVTQLHYMQKINACEGITGTELAKDFGVSKPTVTNIVSRLEREGYIKKERPFIDRRISHIYLTREGEKVLAVERQGCYDYAHMVRKTLTEEEVEQLCTLFNKLL